MNFLTIIARYQEDLSWVEKLDTDVIIYNKGESYPYDYPKIDLENIGREAETFLRAIIEFYDKLNEYDGLIFLQGNPFEHCEDVLEKINNIKKCDEIIYLTNQIKFNVINANHKIHNKSSYIISYMFGESAKNFDKNQDTGWFKVALLCECLGISLEGIVKYDWAYGAQYMVPSKFILKKPITWWEDTLKTLFLYLNVLSTKEEATIIFEFSWPLIYDPKYKLLNMITE